MMDGASLKLSHWLQYEKNNNIDDEGTALSIYVGGSSLLRSNRRPDDKMAI